MCEMEASGKTPKTKSTQAVLIQAVLIQAVLIQAVLIQAVPTRGRADLGCAGSAVLVQAV
jgi:hypothetical protein